MTIPQIYDSKPKAEYPKTEFVDFCHKLLIDAESSEEWIEAGVKAPTRGTVMNWCTGLSKPTNPYYLKVLSKGLNIPIDQLF